MKSSDVKPCKPKTANPEASRDTPQKVPTTSTSKERQNDISPLKTEESFNSARNSKQGSKNSLITYEPTKSRSFVYSVISPTSYNAGLNSFTSYRSSLHMHKSQEKRSETLPSENPVPVRKIPGKSSPNNKHFYPPARDLMSASPSKSLVFQEILKKGPVLDRHSRGSKPYNGTEESSQDRRSNPPREHGEAVLQPKLIQNTSSKSSLKQTPQKVNAKGSSAVGASPSRSFLNGQKLKGAGHKQKNEYLFSRLRSSHMKHANGVSGDSQNDEKDVYLSTSTSQNYKQQDSLIKRATSSLTNNNSILGMSCISKVIDSRNSKDNSYIIKDTSTLKIEERRHMPEKKESKSTDDFKSRYYHQKNNRPDPSFDMNYLQSVRSVEFYPSPVPGEDNKTLTINNRTLSSTRLENLINEDKPRRDGEVEDWRLLSEKSKKNFLNFHRLFTEDKRASLGQERYHNQLVSEIMKGHRSVEEGDRSLMFLKSKKQLELDLNATELVGMETLVTPKLFNEGEGNQGRGSSKQSESPRRASKTEQSPDEMYMRRYPKTTKYNNSSKIELAQAFSSKNKRSDTMEPKINHSREKSGDSSSLYLHINRSLVVPQMEKGKEAVKKNKKSRTLLSNEIEEKIGQFENKKTEVQQLSKKSSMFKDKEALLKARNDTDISLTAGHDNGESFMQPKAEAVNLESQLKTLYIKIKDSLEKTRQENLTLIMEKKQLVERIDTLEKRLSVYEQKGVP